MSRTPPFADGPIEAPKRSNRFLYSMILVVIIAAGLVFGAILFP